MPMTRGRESHAEYRAAKDDQRGRAYGEDFDLFADEQPLFDILAMRYRDDDSANGERYRNALASLSASDRSALFQHLKGELGMRKRSQGELMELAILSAESWLEGWLER
jgi:hypothetical protein